MKKVVFGVVAIMLLAGCPAEMWIPIETVPRAAVSFEHVQFIDSAPDRPYTVVGIITPPPGEYETEAQAVKAIRKEAAKHGADAIFIESKSESTGWKFDSGFLGAKGGAVKEMEFRAKAIVWQK
jgi:hypothetical protein